MCILPPDGDLPALQGQGGVHILYPGQSQKHRGLVDPAAFHLHGLPIYIERIKLCHKLRGKALRVQLDLAFDAVGVDDMAHGDIYRTHSAPSSL